MNFKQHSLAKSKKKKKHFAKRDISSITDNKSFWQTVKPLFSNKVKSQI